MAWYLMIAVTVVATSSVVAQQCQPFWVKPDPFVQQVYGSRLAVYDDGSGPALYARGSGFARWNGRSWQSINQGLPPLSFPEILGVLDDGNGPRLYAWGSSGTPSVDLGFVWANTHWDPMPSGMLSRNGSIWSVPHVSCSIGSGVAIYGIHSSAATMGLVPARWSGQVWTPIGGPLNNAGSARMDVLDMGQGARIYVTGSFAGIGTLTASGIAEWDGTTWRALGAGLDIGGAPKALVVFDAGTGPELYVLGNVVGAGGIPVNGSAKWNGQAWSAMPAGGPGSVNSAAVFDDGTEPALFVGGPFSFSTPGGIARGIAKFDGTQWHPLGAGINTVTIATSMAVFDDGRGPSLFVSSGGPATTVGGGFLGQGVAQWVGCPNCYADCDNSQGPMRLTANDFMCFINRYVVRDPYANCNVDATIDVSDFMCFINKFAAGCP